uniref:Thioesterase domain-containing protein n=1 Tax=Panagrolaimus sp. ES5 TaxID=591445 RepID=A0AC34GVS1_9BILA
MFTGRPEWNETFMKYTSKVKVIDAKPNSYVKYEYTVTKDVLNTVGKLHEGCVATLLDVCMASLICDENQLNLQQNGVTVDLEISHLNTVDLGETIIIDAKSLKNGKKLVVLQAKVYRKSDKEIVAFGKQILAHIPKEYHKNS